MHSAQVTHIRVRLAATGRLALVYGVSVATLVALLLLWTHEWHGALYDALTFDLRLLITLSLSLFVLLSLFGRLGFVLAWAALCLIWITGPLRWIPVGVLAGFVLWSILAVPLYLLWVVGSRDWASVRGMAFITHVVCLFGAWLCLLAFTLAIVPAEHLFIISAIDGMFAEPSPVILRHAGHAWGPVPFLIAIQAIASVLAKPVGSRPAAV